MQSHLFSYFIYYKTSCPHKHNRQSGFKTQKSFWSNSGLSNDSGMWSNIIKEKKMCQNFITGYEGCELSC